MADVICPCGAAVETASRRPRKFCATCRPSRNRPPRTPKPLKTATCVVCGDHFQTRSSHARLCGKQDCKWRNQPKMPCSKCGSPTGYRAGDGRNPKSPKCRPCLRIAEHGSRSGNCIADGCDQQIGKGSRGMCRKHYKAWDYQRPPADESERCSVEGCTRRAHLKKTHMCYPHHSTEFRRQRTANGIPRSRERSRKSKQINCERCGREHWVESSSPTRFCSLTCAQNKGKSCSLVIYTGPRHRNTKTNKNPIPKRSGTLKSGQCRACASWFITFNMDVTCSAKCQRYWKKRSPAALEQKRMSRDRRRARKRDAFVAPVWRKKVYAADGYRCHLCNRKCKDKFSYLPNSQVPHPLSPTLDHVIPLAKGGTHEPSNCRTACYECNNRKGDRGGGEQFALTLTG